SGANPDPRIIPFRGSYLQIVPQKRDLVQSMIYPVPHGSLVFLGVHFTRRIDGDVLIGPTAVLVGSRNSYNGCRVDPRELASILSWPGTPRMARQYWRTAFGEWYRALRPQAIVRAASEYVPGLTIEDVVRGPSGVRAQCVSRKGVL